MNRSQTADKHSLLRPSIYSDRGANTSPCSVRSLNQRRNAIEEGKSGGQNRYNRDFEPLKAPIETSFAMNIGHPNAMQKKGQPTLKGLA